MNTQSCLHMNTNWPQITGHVHCTRLTWLAASHLSHLSLEILHGICGHDEVSTISSIQQYCSRETTKLTTILGHFSSNHEPSRRDRSACIIGVVIHLPCIVSNIALIFSSCTDKLSSTRLQPTPDRESVRYMYSFNLRHVTAKHTVLALLVYFTSCCFVEKLTQIFLFLLLPILNLNLRQRSADICSEIKHPTFGPSQAGFIQAQASRWR